MVEQKGHQLWLTPSQHNSSSVFRVPPSYTHTHLFEQDFHRAVLWHEMLPARLLVYAFHLHIYSSQMILPIDL
jgi:hypothetical protein